MLNYLLLVILLLVLIACIYLFYGIDTAEQEPKRTPKKPQRKEPKKEKPREPEHIEPEQTKRPPVLRPSTRAKRPKIEFVFEPGRDKKGKSLGRG